MQSFFITATGTGIGKSHLTCTLTQQWQAAGKRVAAIKPVISGFDFACPEESDTGRILQALGHPITPNNIETVSPWRFAAPLSPDMVARQENRSIKFKELVSFCQQKREADILLIEGVGGVMSPITETHTNLDLIEALQIPAILIAGSYLGTITHTLTAYEALKSRNISVHSIVISESENETIPLEETQNSLQTFTKNTCDIQLLPRTMSTTWPVPQAS